jgi:hypothetical protein
LRRASRGLEEEEFQKRKRDLRRFGLCFWNSSSSWRRPEVGAQPALHHSTRPLLPVRRVVVSSYKPKAYLFTVFGESLRQ